MHSDLVALERNPHIKIAVCGMPDTGKTEFGVSGPPRVGIFEAEPLAEPFKLRFPEVHGVRPRGEDGETLDAVDGMAAAIVRAREGVYGLKTLFVDGWNVAETQIARGYADPYRVEPGQRAQAWSQIKLAIKERLLYALDGPTQCHIVVSTREKNEWGKDAKGRTNLSEGVTNKQPDSFHDHFRHPFDIIFRMTYDAKLETFSAVVLKSKYRTVFPLGKIVTNLSWKDLDPITTGDVQITIPTIDELTEMYARAVAAGKLPQGSFGTWAKAAGLVNERNQMGNASKLKAYDILEALLVAEPIIENAA